MSALPNLQFREALHKRVYCPSWSWSLPLTFNCRPLTSSCLEDSRFEVADVGIERGSFEGPDQRVAGMGGIDDRVDPKAGGGVARIRLVFVGGADGFVQFFFLFFVYLL